MLLFRDLFVSLLLLLKKNKGQADLTPPKNFLKPDRIFWQLVA
jgi:hypothetical protein